MPTITKITQQQRRKDRYSIYIDGTYELSLSELELVDAGWHVGDAITAEELLQLQSTSELGKALDRAYNYISLRPRSRQEVAVYFRRKDYADEVIDRIITELEHRHLLDDAQFAATWVEERLQINRRSRQQLKTELLQKGIESDVIETALQVVDQDTEVATICQLIESKRLLYRYDDPRKLIQHLASKGFRYDTIKAAIEQLRAGEEKA